MSRVDLDAPEHRLCSAALDRAREALELRTASYIRMQKRAEKAEAEVKMLRAAIDEAVTGIRGDKMKPNCPKCGKPGQLYDSSGEYWLCFNHGGRSYFSLEPAEAARYAKYWGSISRTNAGLPNDKAEDT